MTPPPSVDAAMERALATLAAARELHAAGHFADALSRGHYASLYASMALLASVGMHGKTHDGVRTLVNLHFVRTGKLPSETSMHLGQIEGARMQADYDLAAMFTAESTNEVLARVSAYIDNVKAALAKPAS